MPQLAKQNVQVLRGEVGESQNRAGVIHEAAGYRAVLGESTFEGGIAV